MFSVLCLLHLKWGVGGFQKILLSLGDFFCGSPGVFAMWWILESYRTIGVTASLTILVSAAFHTEMEPVDDADSASRADASVDAFSDDVERKLDKALSEKDSTFILDLVEGNKESVGHEQSEPSVCDGAAFHKAAPPSDRRPVSAPTVPGRELQSVPSLNEVAFDKAEKGLYFETSMGKQRGCQSVWVQGT